MRRAASRGPPLVFLRVPWSVPGPVPCYGRRLQSMSELSPHPTPPLWRRTLFLWTSAAIAVAVMVAAREVMLPFILAVVIAYVLTPLVAALERRKMPRALAVLCVYTVVLGSLGGFAAAIAPRIAHEFRNLRQELPRCPTRRRTGGSRRSPSVSARSASRPAPPPTPERREPPPASAFVARPQPDGSIAIDVGTGVSVVDHARRVGHRARARRRRSRRSTSTAS